MSPNDKILFINASGKEHYEKGKRQNYLHNSNVDNIIETNQLQQKKSRFSRLVSLQEIKENEFNFNISRYVNLTKEKKQVDLQVVTKQLKEYYAKIESSRGS